ncbi:MAG: polysaccharide biosynthesis C-terminal domain-containing protein [Candidatus Liptonbacteria bacterium]|nr:polysaccharide biosynthesis C-terminal domain-containing protein [Candidatus Liptonbacteria bacterium]
MEIQAIITTITNVSIAIFGFAILHFAGTAKALTITYALSAGTGALASIIAVKREFGHVIKNFNKSLVRPVISATWPMAFTALIGAFMLNTDVIMLGWFKDATEVGLYSAGQKVVLLLYALPTIFVTSVFPVLSRLVGQNEEERVRELVEKSMALINAMAIPLSVGGIILGQSLIEFLYGAEFTAAATTFRILMLTILFTYAGGFIGNLILAYNMQRKVPLYWGASSAGNFILNAVLIPPFGAMGAAIATVIAQVMVNGLGWLMIRRVKKFYILKYLKNIAVAAILMGAASFFMDFAGVQVLINIFLSACLYWLILYFLKENLVSEILELVKRV